MKASVVALLLSFIYSTCWSWNVASTPRYRNALKGDATTMVEVKRLEEPKLDHETDRRLFSTRMLQGAAASAIFCALTPAAAKAKASQQDIEDKAKLVAGLKRLNFLLDNWESETTVCGQSDNPYIGLCERTPIKVMDYMGYKNIKDPLFKADKTLMRLSSSVSPDNAPEYLDAMEKWGEAAEEASGMAYISSWGEANPGGGKDRVALFLERAKKHVIDARDSLASALDLLEV